MSQGADPLTNRNNALQILSWRRFRSRALRAGHHLPFHKAVDFFALQACSRPHDKVFGILGIASSRIRVDYSTSIMELFMATLADYFLSLGFVTEDLTPIRRRKELISKLPRENNLNAPFLAFGLDPLDPVVYLVTREIAEFFVPGRGDILSETAAHACWVRFHRTPEEYHNQIVGDEPKFEVRYIASACVRVVKLLGNELRDCSARVKATRAHQQSLGCENAEIMAPDQGGGQTRKYSEWVSTARALSQTMWGRFQQSGEDVEGEMDDEAWTLIG